MKKLLFLFTLLISTSKIGNAQTNVISIASNGGTPYGISPNGKYVTGFAGTGGGYLFTVDSLLYDTIGGSGAYAVSNNRHIAGYYKDPAYNYLGVPYPIAGIWNNSWSTPGPVPGIPSVSSTQYSYAFGISDNGDQFCGMVWLNAGNTQAFMYKPGSGYTLLDDRHQSSKAMTMSGDGKKAGGWQQGNTRIPIIWLPDSVELSQDVGEVHFMNRDASVVAGVNVGNAFLWDSINGIQFLPMISGASSADAMGVSDNGVVVGFYNTGPLPSFTKSAFIYFPGQGMINLVDFLNSVGATNVPANIDAAMGISRDGRRIIAYGGQPRTSYVIELDSSVANVVTPVSTERFYISPNPATNGSFNINGNFNSDNATVTICDMNGRQVKSVNLTKEDSGFNRSIELKDENGSMISDGVYLVSLITAKGSYTLRLIVN